MGVPKFYRWISERYPFINESVDEHSKPDFDALYLDMNGILHGATHGENLDPAEAFDMGNVMLRVFRYIDRLIRIARPRKLLYLALDGVAPRAKMNQQRSRRFRSAKEAALAHEALLYSGKVEESHEMFDSNAITPGTEFMHSLTPHLNFYIQKKMNEDPMWASLKVIFSSHEVPGEGEHKIMSYIRGYKMQPDYDPNFSHCIYGLDADLIFLGLVTHELHVALLREVVDFGAFNNKFKNNRSELISSSNFQLLHISILREYLDFEFRMELPFGYDLERIIDDFVLLCCLVGNDFLPHLPSMDIHEGALDSMLTIYRELLPSLPGYISDGSGNICPTSLHILFKRLGVLEFEVLSKRAARLTKLEKRGSRGQKAHDIDFEEHSYSGNYYTSKWKSPDSRALRENVCTDFMQGLMWTMQYYYQGVCSWGWYYPHYYGPLISDMVTLNAAMLCESLSFEKGAPFRPLEQLMSVLPSESAALVPKPLATLMTDKKSKIADFYPSEFDEDYNGKRNSWEAVVLIPFVDEKRLLSAIHMALEDTGDDPDIERRNRFGTSWEYSNTGVAGSDLTSTLPSTFPDIPLHTVVRDDFDIDALGGDSGNFIARPNPGTERMYPSWPYVPSVSVACAELSNVGVNVFGRESKKETVMISLPIEHSFAPLNELAASLLGKEVFIDWPFNHLAKVEKISTRDSSISCSGVVCKFKRDESIAWDKRVTDWKVNIGSSRALEVGEISVIVECVRLCGMTSSEGKLRRNYNVWNESTSILVPLQLVVVDYPTSNRFLEMDEVSPSYNLNSRFVYLGQDARVCGSVGTIVCTSDRDPNTFSIKVCKAPDDRKLLQKFKAFKKKETRIDWFSAHKACKMLKITNSVLSRISSSLHVKPGDKNLGLEMKFKKRQVLVNGLVRKKTFPDGNISHEYSRVAIDILSEYKERFPLIFELAEVDGATVNMSSYIRQKDLKLSSHDAKVYCEAYIQDVDQFVQESIRRSGPLIHEDSEYCSPAELDFFLNLNQPKESVVLTLEAIPTPELFLEAQLHFESPTLHLRASVGDRVVYLGGEFGVPFGTRGVIIGIHHSYGLLDVLWDIPVVCGVELGGICPPCRGNTITPNSVFNITAKYTRKSTMAEVPETNSAECRAGVLNNQPLIKKQKSKRVAANVCKSKNAVVSDSTPVKSTKSKRKKKKKGTTQCFDSQTMVSKPRQETVQPPSSSVCPTSKNILLTCIL